MTKKQKLSIVFGGIVGVAIVFLIYMLQPSVVRIATFNIQATSETDILGIHNLLMEEGVDVVGMQEVDKNNSRNDYDMLGKMVEEGTYSYSMFQKSGDAYGGEYGNGIISKYELVNVEGNIFVNNADGDNRSWQKVEIVVDGKRVSIYNTHLTYVSQEIRAKQLQELKDIMDRDKNKYKILVGDLNTDQSHDEINIFLDNYNIANGKDGTWYDTFNNKNNVPNTMKTYAVDNIITSKNLKVENIMMVQTLLSDHNLFYIDITLY